jgi:hypothetical protein
VSIARHASESWFRQSEDIFCSHVKRFLLVSYSLQRALIVETEVAGMEDIVSVGTARKLVQ